MQSRGSGGLQFLASCSDNKSARAQVFQITVLQVQMLSILYKIMKKNVFASILVKMRVFMFIDIHFLHY